MSEINRISQRPLPQVQPSKGPQKGEDAAKPGAQVVKTDGSPAVVYTPNGEEVVRGYEKHAHIYNKPKIEAMKADAERSMQGLIDAVRSMVEKQGLVYQDVLKAVKDGKEVVVKIDDETRAKAQAAIADDGEWGVAKTSERIIDFAKSLAGDDKSKYEALVAAIKEGFEAAKSAFGGELPEISQKTYDAVMKGLQEWAGVEPEEPAPAPAPEPEPAPAPEPVE